MKGLWTLVRRELAGYFHAPIAYVVGTAFLAVNGFAFWAIMKALSDPKQPAEAGAVLRNFFGGTLLHWLTVFAVIALLAMRSVAEDRRSGNWEALLTTRIRVPVVLLGKWLALVAFYLSLWLLTLSLLIIFSHYLPRGQGIDLGPVLSAYLGLGVVGAALLAIGLTISASTDNQIVAAVLSFAVSMLWLMAAEVGGAGSTFMRWLLLSDLRANLELAARGEIVPSFYLRQLALVLVVLSLAVAIAERQRRERLHSLVAAGLLLVAGSSASILADRHSSHRDWSAAQVNSLDASSLAVLSELRQPMEIILVKPSEAVFDSVHQELSRLLARMRRAQPLVHVLDLDPLDNSARVQAWAFELAISDEDLSSGGAVIVQQGTRRRVIDLLALASFAPDDLGVGALKELRAEAAIRDAITQVKEVPAERLCATAGHGELVANGDGLAPQLHWQSARDRLDASGVEVEVLWSLEAARLKACDTLVIMGPSAPFSPQEALTLDGYLSAGGNALVALRSQLRDRQDTGVDAGLGLVLGKRGMQVGEGLIVDPEHQLETAPDWMTYEGYGDHAIVRDFYQQRATVWRAPLALYATNDAVAPLIHASSSAWAERDRSALLQEGHYARGADDFEAGEVALAHRASNGSRLVLVGSAESLSSLWSERGVAGNERFLVSAILWTLGRDVQLSMDSKTPEHLRLLMRTSDLRWAFVWCVLITPSCFGLFGALLYFLRRRERQA